MFEKLIEWSRSEYSHLPWRKKRSLYRTLVSEIMLQQTTVGTVMGHFDRFLNQYPSIEELAETSEEEICIAWKGLGYYRRARNLRKAAIDIAEQYAGKIPSNKSKLLAISGVGEYTANALLAIGMDKQHLAVDANLERVLSRLFAIDVDKGPKLQKEISQQFEQNSILHCRDNYSFRQLNEALMDLGRVYCKANKAHCDLCPMSESCKALDLGKPLMFPKQSVQKKKNKYFELNLLKIVVKRGDKVLANKRADDQWLSGQIELPTFILHSEDSQLDQYPELKGEVNLDLSHVIKSSITKYKIKNYIIILNNKEFKELVKRHSKNFKYYPIEGQNFTSTSLKVLKHFN